MLRLVSLFLFFLICISANAADSTGKPGSVPQKDTPRKLQDAWLAFHATDLCQEVDAVFVFHKRGMEAWGRIESDRAYQKFQTLFGSLRDSHAVALYITRAEAEKKRDDEDPPPSLWQNLELRSNLGENVPAIAGRMFEENLQSKASPMPDRISPFLKQRLKIYAEQVLLWNNKAERYSVDLAALARVAYSPDTSTDIKPKAIAACRAHARNLDRHLGKLTANLEQAFPVSERKKRASSDGKTPERTLNDPVEAAIRISTDTQSVSRRIYHFIYPEIYTVELNELLHPSLLDSLGALRETVAAFSDLLSGWSGKK